LALKKGLEGRETVGVARNGTTSAPEKDERSPSGEGSAGSLRVGGRGERNEEKDGAIGKQGKSSQASPSDKKLDSSSK